MTSECWQNAAIDKDGNIIGYGTIEEVAGEVSSITCPMCEGNLKELVTE